MRLALALLGLTLLSACNVVMTKTPLFTTADSAGAPTLRPGVWVFFKEPGCQVDESKPFADWPDCSGGGIVSATELAGHKKGTPKDALERTPFVLASGDPRIGQVQITIDMSAGADASASGGGEASASVSVTQPKSQPYGYAAIRPTKLDPQGRIVAFASWPVLCGPPPPKDKDGNDTAMATLHPLPGIEMKPGDAVCTTRSIPALRGAAKASEAWADKPLSVAHWVRDGAR